MAVRIRLKKMGRRHRPFFRICAMDARTQRDGRVIEELGYYDPMIPETDARAILKGERIDYWLGVGAQPTEKVGVLIKKYGSQGTHLDQQKAALQRLGRSHPLAAGQAWATRQQAKREAAQRRAAQAPQETEQPAPAESPETEAASQSGN